MDDWHQPGFLNIRQRLPVPPHNFRRSRLAPTPSGYLHLGNAFSFALTAALAHHSGAELLLRIDDMDRNRVDDAYVQDVFDTLGTLEIDWQLGPRNAQEFKDQYSQRLRMPLYHELLNQLVRTGLVYACSCSRSDVLSRRPDGQYDGHCRHRGLPLDTPGTAWRLNTTGAGSLLVNTLQGQRQLPYPENMTDVLIRKKDGDPAYQVCSLADDLHFGIDFIVRGSDLWPSTLVQLHLARLVDQSAFGAITFHHHHLLQDAKGNKLSKSAGDTSIRSLTRSGCNRQQLYGLLFPHTHPAPQHWREIDPFRE